MTHREVLPIKNKATARATILTILGMGLSAGCDWQDAEGGIRQIPADPPQARGRGDATPATPPPPPECPADAGNCVAGQIPEQQAPCPGYDVDVNIARIAGMPENIFYQIFGPNGIRFRINQATTRRMLSEEPFCPPWEKSFTVIPGLREESPDRFVPNRLALQIRVKGPDPQSVGVVACPTNDEEPASPPNGEGCVSLGSQPVVGDPNAADTIVDYGDNSHPRAVNFSFGDERCDQSCGPAN